MGCLLGLYLPRSMKRVPLLLVSCSPLEQRKQYTVLCSVYIETQNWEIRMTSFMRTVFVSRLSEVERLLQNTCVVLTVLDLKKLTSKYSVHLSNMSEEDEGAEGFVVV